MKKILAENLHEWTSTHTGVENYGNNAITIANNGDNTVLDDDRIQDMLPPSSIKLSEKDLELLIDELIILLNQSPSLAMKLFSGLVKTHPYLTTTRIGFNKPKNSYSAILKKFTNQVYNIQ